LVKGKKHTYLDLFDGDGTRPIGIQNVERHSNKPKKRHHQTLTTILLSFLYIPDHLLSPFVEFSFHSDKEFGEIDESVAVAVEEGKDLLQLLVT
jgi:predicted DNA-binding ArsR family transcriptional regulator